MSRKHITKIKARAGLLNRPSVTSDKFKGTPELNNRVSRDRKVLCWQPYRKLSIERNLAGAETGCGEEFLGPSSSEG